MTRIRTGGRPAEFGTSPILIFIDQVVSSGSNALAIFAAAWILSAPDLNVYALLQLIATTLIALQRAILLEPSLSLSNERVRADSSAYWAFLVLLPAAALGVGIGYMLFGSWLGALATAALVFPCFQDLLRYRSFSLGRVRRALSSDLAWLVLFAGAVLAFPEMSTFQLFLAWATPALLAALLLVCRRDSRERVPVTAVLALGRYQIVEWAIGSTTASLPLFVAQAVVSVSSVGAFRLAQTLTGPLNTISSFVTLRFLIDAPKLRALDPDESRGMVRRAGTILVMVAVAYSTIAVAAFFVFAGTLDEEIREPLYYALPLTLLSSVITAPAAAYVAYIKAVGEQRATIRPRVVTLAANIVATLSGVGFALALGMDPIVLPVAVTGLVLVVAWHRAFVTSANRARPENAAPTPGETPGAMEWGNATTNVNQGRITGARDSPGSVTDPTIDRG